jgi:uncharacterized SAM-dependent methyltransferase
LEEPKDGVLQFETDTDTRRSGLHRVRKHFHVFRDLELLIAGETLRLYASEVIEMNWSYKYSRETFLEVLLATGISPLNQYVSDDGRFLMVLGQKR